MEFLLLYSDLTCPYYDKVLVRVTPNYHPLASSTVSCPFSIIVLQGKCLALILDSLNSFPSNLP